MENSHNILWFEENLTLYIFIAHGPFSITEFSDFVDQVSLTTIPDRIELFTQEKYLQVKIFNIIQQQLKSRFKIRATIHQFNHQGEFSTENAQTANFLEKCLKRIIQIRKPILYPPPGKSFIKPSGTRESFFIQTGNLFSRHAEMCFLALLLIREWGPLLDDTITTIYVDTIDLYGLTSLACRMRFGHTPQTPITVSYSSYDNYKETLRHADPSKSLMVISATTSHNLLKKIITKTRWKAIDRVVTILATNPDILSQPPKIEKPKVIAQIQPEDAQPHLRLLPSIRLAGEKFSIEADTPKSVLLNTNSHSECLKDLKLNVLSSMHSLLNGYGKSGNNRLPLAIDEAAILKSPPFLDWLSAEVEKHAPASTRYIVHTSGEKEAFTPLLRLFGSTPPEILKPEDLLNTSLKINGSIIVICPCFSNGSRLLEISRDLRKHTNVKNIIYFTGLGTPESADTFKRLKNNLEHGSYHVRSFLNINTGSPECLSLSWQSEQDILREDALACITELKIRATALENGGLGDNQLYYRSSDLVLHKKFKYWEGKLGEYPSSRPGLLLFSTFAFLLQNARTNITLPDKDRLAPLTNRRVLLDPENFFRYNDSLIQATLLRAAFPGELDYSDHDTHSASIYYLIQRAEQTKDRSLIYEFLMALASRRLCVNSRTYNSIKELIQKSTMIECQWLSQSSFFK